MCDPLGLELPVILKGRRIIQKLCQGNTAWDDTISDEVQKEWTKINASSVTKSAVFNCVTSRRLREKMGVQVMADLLKDMFQEAAPFIYCAVYMFVPFKIKVKQSEVKCYGAMFTCLASRAVHTEVSYSMTTDSFIQALRRQITRRGIVRQICLDNGQNLVGVEQELIHAFSEMDHTKIQGFLQNKNADLIKWKRNPSAASHMGGILERQIHSARGILASLLQTHGHSLDEESLQTLVAEREAVFNS